MFAKKIKLEKPLNKYDTFLSRQGYSISKKSLTEKDIETIYKALTVAPAVNPQFAGEQKDFYLYGETKTKIYMPRYWGIYQFGEPKTDKLRTSDMGLDIDIPFNGAIRKTQEPVVAAFLEKTKKKEGGIITLKCGGGKTVTALYLASLLKKKTLVVVHKTFLMSQWHERITQFLPSARVGFIQGEVIDIADKDIILGMLQSISMKDYHRSIFKDIGFVVFDECHHLGAEVFSRALTKVACPYTLGLSATPDRGDGLTKVFMWYLGDFIYRAQEIRDSNVKVDIYYYINDDPSYSEEQRIGYNNLNMSRMLNNISFCKRRNDFILALLPDLLKQKRQILILCDRKEQIFYLGSKIEELEIGSYGYYIGGLKQSQLDEAMTKDIMIGTYNMVSEGFDCKKLDTLILASPRSNVKQSVGRILRVQAKDRTVIPLVIDIGDVFSIYTSQLDKRIRLYEKEGYDIDGIWVDDCLVQTKITKMDRYFDLPVKNNGVSIIKLRRLKKAAKMEKEASGVCLMDF